MVGIYVLALFSENSWSWLGKLGMECGECFLGILGKWWVNGWERCLDGLRHSSQSKEELDAIKPRPYTT
jgi:hypothetical protein